MKLLKKAYKLAALFVLVGAVGMGIFLALRSSPPPQLEPSALIQPQADMAKVASQTSANRAEIFSTTAASRLLVTQTNLTVQPALADGKDTNSIRQWAHNELEVQRMLNENEKIFRRQLVTLKETVATIVERNRLTGAQISELTLPGLDGQEIKVQVNKSEISPSGQRGSFNGNVAGRPGSMVTLAFLNGRQAYTILSPEDNLYLDVEPHDSGDVIVKAIDPNTYGRTAAEGGDDFIDTTKK